MPLFLILYGIKLVGQPAGFWKICCCKNIG